MLGLENLCVRIKENECDVDLLRAALYTCLVGTVGAASMLSLAK